MPLSFIPEFILKTFHYQNLKALAPSHKGVFEGTPVRSVLSPILFL